MKKLVLVLGLVAGLGLQSCQKEIDANKVCNCGLILSDNVQNYSVNIRNSCSNNVKTFYLQPGDWMNAYVGSNFCVTNQGQW